MLANGPLFALSNHATMSEIKLYKPSASTSLIDRYLLLIEDRAAADAIDYFLLDGKNIDKNAISSLRIASLNHYAIPQKLLSPEVRENLVLRKVSGIVDLNVSDWELVGDLENELVQFILHYAPQNSGNFRDFSTRIRSHFLISSEFSTTLYQLTAEYGVVDRSLEKSRPSE